MENEEAQVVKLLHTSALDVIQILGLTARGRHGVYPSERANGQAFSVDVTMHVDTRAAATDDDLSLTVDYSAVAEDVVEILSGNPVYLIETLAQRVAEAVLNYESVQIVEVKVHKPNAPMDLKFSDVSMTIRRTRSEKTELSTPLSQRADERETITAVIGLGANLDKPWKTLAQAVMEIDSHAHMNVIALSGLFASEPVLATGQDAQPEYYNAVAQVQTTLAPHDLLVALQEVENAHGRVRTERWGARTLDLDIIAIDGLRLDTPELTVPHPRAHERAFVLLPWTQIDSEATLGKRGRVKVLAEQVSDQKIRSVADVWVDRALLGQYPADVPAPTAPTPIEPETKSAEETPLLSQPPLGSTTLPPKPGKRSARHRQAQQVADRGPAWSRPREQSHVRIIDDLDEKDEVIPRRRHSTRASASPGPRRSHRPIMKVDLPKTMERGLLPIDDEPTGPIRRSAVRPSVTGAIPIIRKGPRNVQEDT